MTTAGTGTGVLALGLAAGAIAARAGTGVWIPTAGTGTGLGAITAGTGAVAAQTTDIGPGVTKTSIGAIGKGAGATSEGASAALADAGCIAPGCCALAGVCAWRIWLADGLGTEAATGGPCAAVFGATGAVLGTNGAGMGATIDTAGTPLGFDAPWPFTGGDVLGPRSSSFAAGIVGNGWTATIGGSAGGAASDAVGAAGMANPIGGGLS